MKINNLKIALCAIGKYEEEYLLEWVEHYKKIGFDNIIFGDNNPINNYKQKNILNPYIDNGFVIYFDLMGNEDKKLQKKFYKKTIKKYKKKYDYIAFFDCDEFITIEKGEENIKSIFAIYDNIFNYDLVTIPMVNMTDNNLTHYENKKLSERFTEYTFKKINVKSILNMEKISIENIFLRSVHRMIEGENFEIDVNDGIYIKHYKFKTIEEFLKKINRGDINYRNGIEEGEKVKERIVFFLKDFFKYNEITYDKIKIANDIFGDEINWSEIFKINGK